MFTVFTEINEKLDKKQETKKCNMVDLKETNTTAGNKKYNNRIKT